MKLVRVDFMVVLFSAVGVLSYAQLAGSKPDPWPAQHAVPSIQDTETPAQRDARMQWWREARFGMFIHWGLYSILPAPGMASASRTSASGS